MENVGGLSFICIRRIVVSADCRVGGLSFICIRRIVCRRIVGRRIVGQPSEILSVILRVNIIAKLISNSSQEILGSLFQHKIDSLDELNTELEGVDLTQEQIQVNPIRLSAHLEISCSPQFC
jgi:hypothetical protein